MKKNYCVTLLSVFTLVFMVIAFGYYRSFYQRQVESNHIVSIKKIDEEQFSLNGVPGTIEIFMVKARTKFPMDIEIRKDVSPILCAETVRVQTSNYSVFKGVWNSSFFIQAGSDGSVQILNHRPSANDHVKFLEKIPVKNEKNEVPASPVKWFVTSSRNELDTTIPLGASPGIFCSILHGFEDGVLKKEYWVSFVSPMPVQRLTDESKTTAEISVDRRAENDDRNCKTGGKLNGDFEEKSSVRGESEK